VRTIIIHTHAHTITKSSNDRGTYAAARRRPRRGQIEPKNSGPFFLRVPSGGEDDDSHARSSIRNTFRDRKPVCPAGKQRRRTPKLLLLRTWTDVNLRRVHNTRVVCTRFYNNDDDDRYQCSNNNNNNNNNRPTGSF
jgi:hypothetical protein